ncbi:MAG: Rrf2 family transcriptional regulator [Proteobacteria bacterium]|nr:Rrf2 family transcriptional regulator [Pseudomonadota bacterium]MBU1741924.1 Rrf2 family transcriptional regulator [Pseudomonadota bacterium]
MSSFVHVSEAASLALHSTVLMAEEADEILTTKEMARCLGASEAHLSKVLQRLTRAGLVESVRGPRGGFRLARGAAQITLLEVWEAIEGRLETSHCLFGRPTATCTRAGCIMGGVMSQVDRMVREYLVGTPLSALTDLPEGETKCRSAI